MPYQQENGGQNVEKSNKTAGRLLIHVKDTTQETKDNVTRTDIAKHLVNVAEKTPVKDTTVVLGGVMLLLGLMSMMLWTEAVETIKYSVAQALKNDRYGANAVIIADPSTMSRLREMSREISEGHPVTGILDELAAIVGRVLPEVLTM